MKSMHKEILLAVITLGVFFPSTIFAATTTPTSLPNNICESTLNAISTMVKPGITVATAHSGDIVNIPLTLQNKTGTPLSDIHLLTRVTRMEKMTGVVSLQYDPKPIVLSPGESATTTVSWNTTKSEAGGFYRVDIFPIPSANFPYSGIAGEGAARANVFVEITGGNLPSDFSFKKEKATLNGHYFYPAKSLLYEEHETGEAGLVISNGGKSTRSVEVRWNVYPYQQVLKDAALISTSTQITVPAKGFSTVVFPVPTQQFKRYTAVAEIIDEGQRVLFPSAFDRLTTESIPISIFGIEPISGDGGAFDLRSGKSYTLFACPFGTSALTATNIMLTVTDGNGKHLVEQSVLSKIKQIVAPFTFTFTSPSNISNAKIILTTSASGKVQQRALPLSCGNRSDGACVPLSFLEKQNISPLSLVLITALFLVAVFVIGKYVYKKRDHE